MVTATRFQNSPSLLSSDSFRAHKDTMCQAETPRFSFPCNQWHSFSSSSGLGIKHIFFACHGVGRSATSWKVGSKNGVEAAPIYIAATES